MPFNAIRENKILAKISGFTVYKRLRNKMGLILDWAFISFVLFMSCVCHAFASVHCCLVVTCWERADLLALVCDV